MAQTRYATQRGGGQTPHGDSGATTRRWGNGGTVAWPGAGVASDAQTTVVARSVGAVGLATIGLIHLLDAPSKLSETPYLFWLYLALFVGCVGGAGLLVRAHSRLAWAAAAVLCLNPLAGYVLSRTTGLPGAMGDIGNWAEPLGLASLFVETGVLALSLYGLSLVLRRDAAGG